MSVGGGSERARALGSRVTRNETKRGGKAKTNSPRVVRPKGRRKSRRLETAGDARGDGAGRSAARGSIAEEGGWDEARTGAVLFHAGGERRGLFLRPRRGRLARGGLGLGLLLLGLRWRGGCGRVVSQNKTNQISAACCRGADARAGRVRVEAAPSPVALGVSRATLGARAIGSERPRGAARRRGSRESRNFFQELREKRASFFDARVGARRGAGEARTAALPLPLFLFFATISSTAPSL